MQSTHDVATAYIDTWNSTAADLDALLGRHWNAEAHYADPLMRASGRREIGQLVAAVHERFPGFRFALLRQPDGHGEFVRLSWTLGPAGVVGDAAPIEGSDLVELRDGRIHRVVGFIDRAPAAAA